MAFPYFFKENTMQHAKNLNEVISLVTADREDDKYVFTTFEAHLNAEENRLWLLTRRELKGSDEPETLLFCVKIYDTEDGEKDYAVYAEDELGASDLSVRDCPDALLDRTEFFATNEAWRKQVHLSNFSYHPPKSTLVWTRGKGESDD
jgi:hypothetical protein